MGAQRTKLAFFTFFSLAMAMADPPRSNRREFLVGRAAGDALVHVVQEAADRIGQFADAIDPPRPEEPQASYVAIVQRRAMACNFEVRLNARPTGASGPATAAALAALDLVEDLETQLTVYRDTSEVVEINRRAADGPVEVEPGLFGLLELADQIHHQSQGAYDLTSGPLSRIWGFHTRQGQLPKTEEIAQALECVGWGSLVRLDRDRQQIAFAKQGVEINVNSLGKGYALDLAAELLRGECVEDFLFHGGRSSLIACGHRDGNRGWNAGLRHPLNPRVRFAMFSLENEALSTSGSATQSFLHRGKRYGHLLDPRTGWPAEGMHSVTVIAPTAAEAEALSTAFYVMGRQATAEYCLARPHLKVLLVLPTTRPGEIEVEAINLRDEEWQIAAASEQTLKDNK